MQAQDLSYKLRNDSLRLSDYKVSLEIFSLENISAHADKEELLSWLRCFKDKPRKIFITHGEEKSANAFAETVKEELGWDSYVPEYLDVVKL